MKMSDTRPGINDELYTSVLTWTHSQNSLAAAEACSSKNVFPWEISQMITKTVLISTRIFICSALKRDIPYFVWQKLNGNWGNNMIRIFQWRESHCRTNTKVRVKNQIQKIRTVRVTVRPPSRKVKGWVTHQF